MLRLDLTEKERNTVIITSKIIVGEMLTIVDALIHDTSAQITAKYGGKIPAAYQLIDGMDMLLPLLINIVSNSKEHNVTLDIHYINRSIRDAVVYTDIYKAKACIDTLDELLCELYKEDE